MNKIDLEKLIQTRGRSRGLTLKKFLTEKAAEFDYDFKKIKASLSQFVVTDSALKVLEEICKEHKNAAAAPKPVEPEPTIEADDEPAPIEEDEDAPEPEEDTDEETPKKTTTSRRRKKK